MNEEEIKEYLNRTDKLEQKLKGKDKETLQWLIFGYNKCAELLDKKEQELQKYKNLYENEKNHTETLKRIINEVKKYLEGTFEMSTYTKSVYLDEESIEELLDLLKEIK